MAHRVYSVDINIIVVISFLSVLRLNVLKRLYLLARIRVVIQVDVLFTVCRMLQTDHYHFPQGLFYSQQVDKRYFTQRRDTNIRPVFTVFVVAFICYFVVFLLNLGLWTEVRLSEGRSKLPHEVPWPGNLHLE
jgi:hypothetical protein